MLVRDTQRWKNTKSVPTFMNGLMSDGRSDRIYCSFSVRLPCYVVSCQSLLMGRCAFLCAILSRHTFCRAILKIYAHNGTPSVKRPHNMRSGHGRQADLAFSLHLSLFYVRRKLSIDIIDAQGTTANWEKKIIECRKNRYTNLFQLSIAEASTRRVRLQSLHTRFGLSIKVDRLQNQFISHCSKFRTQTHQHIHEHE